MLTTKSPQVQATISKAHKTGAKVEIYYLKSDLSYVLYSPKENKYLLFLKK